MPPQRQKPDGLCKNFSKKNNARRGLQASAGINRHYSYSISDSFKNTRTASCLVISCCLYLCKSPSRIHQTRNIPDSYPRTFWHWKGPGTPLSAKMRPPMPSGRGTRLFCQALVHAHCRFDCPAETVHRIACAKLQPEMLRVAVAAGNAPRTAFLMADDDAVRKRVKTVLFTEHVKQLHRRLISPFHHCLCRRSIGAGEAAARCVSDAGRLAHLHPDMGIVAAPLRTAPTMPAPVVPWKRLVCRAIIAVNETMDAGSVMRRAVPSR